MRMNYRVDKISLNETRNIHFFNTNFMSVFLDLFQGLNAKICSCAKCYRIT